MKKYCLPLLCLAVVAMCSASAWAIPPFDAAFKKMYVKEGDALDAKVKETKCNVCHVGKEKKDKNEYGKAVGKYLKKADFTGDAKKFDNVKSDEAQKALADGLQSAEAEKSSGGKSFGELIKAGELPAK